MADQVNRRKSYRWTSAGQTSYDGADWDSSEEETPKMALPSLPPLEYSKEEEEEKEPVQETHTQQEVVPEPVPEPVPEQPRDQVSRPVPVQVELGDSHSSRTPRLGKNSQFTDGLDDLMVQISKEMTPKEQQDATFDEERPQQRGYFASMVDTESEEQSSLAESVVSNEQKSPVASQVDEQRPPPISHNDNANSDSTIQLAASGDSSVQVYATPEAMPLPNDAMKREGKDTGIQSGDSAPLAQEESDTDRSSFFDGYEDSNDETGQVHSKEEGDSNEAEEENHVGEVDQVPDVQEDAAPSSKADLSYNSSDDTESRVDDDALSYTNSIAYESEDNGETGDDDTVFRFHNKAQRESIIESSSDDASSSGDNLTMNVPQSGYFDKIVGEDKDDEESDDDILSMPDSVASNQDSVNTLEESAAGSAEAVQKSVEGDEEPENNGEERASNDSNEPGSDIVEPTSDIEEPESNDEEPVSHDDDHLQNGDSSQNAESDVSADVDLGKWKPDTDALRSGFVQETAKKAPPGFVYDENGNLVDLTPSGMKGRAVSTYSGVESGWNAFPSEDGDGDGDIETIRDTKTLYDNSTIYNVPGLVGRNQKLPPLPSDIAPVPVTAAAPAPVDSTLPDDTRTRSVSNATYSSERRPDVVGIQEPNSLEIAKLSHHTHAVPELDLNKLIQSKTSNEAKYTQLTGYYAELGEYDTGVQTWISYSLKSSTKDKDFLFDEYKINRHVREAYANAEDLTKKNTVINTVNTVNQNVNHLKKKVFSHTRNSMKPKMLFSSIGKKVL